MSYTDYTTVIQSKVQGSWNLHELIPSSSLEFFIMLSSLSGLAGNTGQANYAAGGTFQDALARHRAALGLPGVSIDLGMVKTVGVLAETKNAALAGHLEKAGPRVIDENMVIRLVESAIQNPRRSPESSQIITAIPPEFMRSVSAAFWNRDIRFLPLERVDGVAAASDRANGAAVGTVVHTRSLLTEVQTVAEARSIINDVLVKRLAKEFGHPETEIDPSMALTDIGVDSLIAVELRNWIVTTLDAECSIFDVIQSSSLTLLVDKLVGNSRLVPGEISKNGNGADKITGLGSDTKGNL
jgi:acyl carrier protein